MIREREIKTKDQAKFPFVFDCDVTGCAWITAHKTRESAEDAETNHPCPKDIGRSYVLSETDEKGQPYTALHYGKSLNEQLWDRLDSIIADIRSGSDNDYNKGSASALAWAVSKMGGPYYPDTELVLKQAMRRWRMKQGEIDWEPTAGYHHNPPPPGTKAFESETARQPRPPQTRKEPIVSETDKTAIKNGLESGFFTVPDLAKAYKITEEQVLLIANA